MKKTLSTLITLLFSFALFAQGTINQNTQFKRVTMFSGRTIVQDTSLYIKSGNDTIKITNYGDTSRFSTTAGGGWNLSPKLDFNELKSNSSLSNYYILNTNKLGFGFLELPGVFSNNLFAIGDLRPFNGGTDTFVIAGRAQAVNFRATGQINIEYFNYRWIQDDRGILFAKNDTTRFFNVDTSGLLHLYSQDSATIYARTSVSEGVQVFCSDCSGDGITGRIVAYIGAAWRRLKLD